MGIFDKEKSKDIPVKLRAEAGETLGRVGDPRDLTVFIPISGGTYQLSIGKVQIEPFEISKYPVTNQWYAGFVEAGGYENPEYWTENGKKWLKATKQKAPRFWDDREWNCPNAPVVGISWYEAAAFMRWLTASRKDGKRYRLLTEAEWEAVAVGLEGRKEPWGDEDGENRCNTEEAGLGKTSPVGIFPLGDTPDGIVDLGGNVWEWTTTDYYSGKTLEDFLFDKELQSLLVDKLDYEKYLALLNEKHRQLPVLKGLAYWNNIVAALAASRDRVRPSSGYYNSGVRCART
jgi:formylglycine-generating enzyme required for sulfatase activity